MQDFCNKQKNTAYYKLINIFPFKDAPLAVK